MIGCFIVLEGIDGCGKIMQIQYLIEWLFNSGLMLKGVVVVCICEFGGIFLGCLICEFLLYMVDQEVLVFIVELLLYVVDWVQYVEMLICFVFECGDWVISDCFLGLIFVY